MEKTDAAVATVADKLGDKALQYLSSFEELAKQYSPDVVDAAFTVIRVNAIQEIAWGLIGLVCLVIGLFIALKHVKQMSAYEINRHDAAFVAGGIMTAIGLCTAYKIFIVWNWVGIFEPKLYLAYKIFGKLF